jgi:RNA polymerase sigma-70 factor (ECF subfamily)
MRPQARSAAGSALLADDVTMWADEGGKARGAATRPLYGRIAVAQFALASTHYLPGDAHVEIAEVNGQPAAIMRVAQHTVLMIAIEVDRDHVRAIARSRTRTS